ncbi:MAG: tyrosine-type recombinase/integrase [Chloroflexi bacterium]|nr:tyrosine-type recombinase/integrase [Chloroflexota bacterium]MBV9597487.1 tyrosine-type recombinase/integrase [Chloroflexota bacterium]
MGRVRVRRAGDTYELGSELGEPLAVVSGFLAYLRARGCSPNTQAAYAYDLAHFFRFLDTECISYQEVTPPRALRLLMYLRAVPNRSRARRLRLVPVVSARHEPAAPALAPSTINHIVSTVSAFYEYLILAGQWANIDNPIVTVPDHERARVSDRYRPFMGYASRQRPIRRAVRVKTPQLLPRPLSDGMVQQLLDALRRRRDRAMALLMLKGGLRPGEVLSLHLEDVHYGRKRVFIRYRTDHPKGARTKGRTERVVDLLEPEVLLAVSDYVANERPRDTGSVHLFLVGGNGQRRAEPLSYQALRRMFTRRLETLGLREPWVTPHSLRHTHATKMWEGGMRELSLQKRLGHASPESTRRYTRVSDAVVVAEYLRAIRGAQQ